VQSLPNLPTGIFVKSVLTAQHSSLTQAIGWRVLGASINRSGLALCPDSLWTGPHPGFAGDRRGSFPRACLLIHGSKDVNTPRGTRSLFKARNPNGVSL